MVVDKPYHLISINNSYESGVNQFLTSDDFLSITRQSIPIEGTTIINFREVIPLNNF